MINFILPWISIQTYNLSSSISPSLAPRKGFFFLLLAPKGKKKRQGLSYFLLSIRSRRENQRLYSCNNNSWTREGHLDLRGRRKSHYLCPFITKYTSPRVKSRYATGLGGTLQGLVLLRGGSGQGCCEDRGRRSKEPEYEVTGLGTGEGLGSGSLSSTRREAGAL